MTRKKLLSIIICAAILLAMMLPAFISASVSAAGTKTVYVASTGSDTNDGSETAPFATIERAWKNADVVDYTIIIVDTVTLGNSSFVFDDQNKATQTTITGADASSVLDLSVKSAIGLYCPGSLTFDSIKLNFVADTEFAANGRKMLITETVTFNNRIKIFGGGRGANVTGDTDLTVLGGIYNRIYGGGFNGSVSGNVNLTVGGVVNAGDGIDDETSNPAISPCQLYGGCYNGTVGGDVNVNYGGNAVTRYISGAGAGTGGINGSININMTGGKANTICGTRSFALTDAKIHIRMTGGLCEAIFGGGESCSITGSTEVYIGGTADVSRRVHGGSYNENTSSGTSRVIGSATVIIDSGCSLASGTDLSLLNRFYMAINAGSRLNTDAADEYSTLIFLNDTYSTYSSKLSSSYKQDYIVKAGTGGTVTGGSTPGTITLLPDDGKAAVIDSVKYAKGYQYTLSAATTDVTFADAVSYKVTLDHNNGTGKTCEVYKLAGDTAVIPGITVTNGDRDFLGWALSSDAHTADYAAGADYTADADVTLYAVWRGPAQQYEVKHVLQNGSSSVTYKTETLTGYVGWLTEAEALDLLGYTANSITQQTVTAGTLVVTVVYVPDNDPLGDVNCDGGVDVLDAVMLQRHLAGRQGYDAESICLFTSDCNKDGKVDTADDAYLIKYLAGWSAYTLD